MKDTPILYTKNLSIGYQHKKEPTVVSNGLNLSLRRGEMVCLLGPNGCGKSTLIRTLSGMQNPLEGTVFLHEDDLMEIDRRELAKRLGLVLTDRITIGNLRVFDLVSFGRSPYTGWFGSLSEADADKVSWSIQATGLDAFVERDVMHLSDGERQKVMIARALAQDTSVILLDEPTAHLDLPNRVEIIRLLRELARQTRKAILFSTHELDLALKAADRIWLMDDHGQLSDGVPEDLVLGGAFERAFHRKNVEFDRQTGSFRLHQPATKEITLNGDPVACFWTRRALEREGFSVTGEKALIGVTVTSKGQSETYRWIVQSGRQTKQVDSVQELIQIVRAYDTASRR